MSEWSQRSFFYDLSWASDHSEPFFYDRSWESDHSTMHNIVIDHDCNISLNWIYTRNYNALLIIITLLHYLLDSFKFCAIAHWSLMFFNNLVFVFSTKSLLIESLLKLVLFLSNINFPRKFMRSTKLCAFTAPRWYRELLHIIKIKPNTLLFVTWCALAYIINSKISRCIKA